jgi:hypothetical protein
MAHTLEQGLERSELRTNKMKAWLRGIICDLPLIYLKNPGGFHNRGFLLALGKTLGAVAVNVHTGEPLSVMIKYRDLPVLVFSSSIAMHSVRLFCSFLFHDEFFPRASNYYKFIGDAQVSN